MAVDGKKHFVYLFFIAKNEVQLLGADSVDGSDVHGQIHVNKTERDHPNLSAGRHSKSDAGRKNARRCGTYAVAGQLRVRQRLQSRDDRNG
jgi:hypothetical protein